MGHIIINMLTTIMVIMVIQTIVMAIILMATVTGIILVGVTDIISDTTTNKTDL